MTPRPSPRVSYKVPRAAAIVGLDPFEILSAISAGDLPARRVPNSPDLLVYADDLDSWRDGFAKVVTES